MSSFATMISDHPSFIHPVNPDVKIWRYTDIAKFLSLLQTSQLYFSSAAKLVDPFEGSVPRHNAQFESHALVQAAANSPTPPGTTPEQFALMLSELSKARKGARDWHYISCWHMNEFESEAMWKLYAQSSESIAIQSTFRKLAQVLPDGIFAGIVHYIDYQKAVIASGNMFNAFLCKRPSFAHERELRAIYSQLSQTLPEGGSIVVERGIGARVPVSLSDLIEVVYVSPSSPVWFLRVVENLVAQAGLNVPVIRSTLDDEPCF